MPLSLSARWYATLSFGLITTLLLCLVYTASAAEPNLVQNGDMEAASGSVPTGWTTDSWGTLAATFAYPVSGQTGNGARVTISGYISGDAKWQHAPVAVTPGAKYQVSDSYMSTAASEVDIEYKLSNGTYSYVVLASPASSAGVWKTFTGQTTAPANAVSMTALHLLQSNGSLTIDNMSVTAGTSTPPPPPPPPPPAKPVINSFSANPTSVLVGSSTTLSWSVTGATTTLSINQGVGTVTGTSKVVSPTATTTYTLTASNAGGTTTAQTTVGIRSANNPPPPPPPPPPGPPTCTLAANPTSIKLGSSTVLSWSSANATSGSINNGVGAVSTTSGTKIVSPTTTTMYIGTFTGQGIAATCSANVTVVQPPPPPPSNLIANGNLEAGAANNPTGWSASYWGTLTAKFTYPVAGKGGGKAAQVQISNFTTGAANWTFNHIQSDSHTMYDFSEDYMATVATEIDIEFLMSDGTYQYAWLANVLPAAAWQTVKAKITVPAGAVSFSVLHVLFKNGTLTIDNASLTKINDPFPQGMLTFVFDDGLTSQSTNAAPILKTAGMKGTFAIITSEPTSGDVGYLTWPQIKALATAGHEIANHTRTHPNLTTITPAQRNSEITGSYNDLVAQGLRPKTFVYPLGAVTAGVETLVKNAGHIGARGSYYGQNTPHNDKYNLYDIRLDQTSKLADIQNFIAQAKADKRWLVFELHDVKAAGDAFAITPAFFQSVVNYAKSSGIQVVTLQQGMALMQ